ncbi:uncharacterized protein LOC111808314 [Cucurbita pepo subsp. pepo]|uniref:uncharacterized protein LOC111808314 n=1 Tax=Cucurbita pepo subsp. pepo TaxID=3664 RepID=UPI000C9D2CCD|nr:uncharacterized protein LOC111808314 [Cucurbita pepo subsp. pepo]XP_023549994.1 uncharacterized protein LOC111808314 [Cucurbita pepo subsp. pepo]
MQMAQYRQSGTDRNGPPFHSTNNGVADHVAVGIRSAPYKQARARRSARSDKGRGISIGAIIFVLSLVLVATVLAYYYLLRDTKEISNSNVEDDDFKNDPDFLANVTRTETTKVRFGKGLVVHGRDSRYWDGDDRRRDQDYNEDVVEHRSTTKKATEKGDVPAKVSEGHREPSLEHSQNSLDRKDSGLYNEAGRKELRKYEAEYEASVKTSGQLEKEGNEDDQVSDDDDVENWNDIIDTEDEYGHGSDNQNPAMEEDDDTEREKGDHSDAAGLTEEDSGKSFNVVENGKPHNDDHGKSLNVHDGETKYQQDDENVEATNHSFDEDYTLSSQNSDKVNQSSKHVGVTIGQHTKRSKMDSRKKPKNRKFSGSSCAIKFSNSTAQILEPLESKKFVRFTLQYTKTEEKPSNQEKWMPRFAGHQTLQERETSFYAQDQKINCGFVKGPESFPSTGFDLAEDDSNYISSCHIAVISCIFGNSDHLRSPTGKTVSRFSRKNVCFVMFMDEVTLETLSTEGQTVDRTGFIGVWKIVVVKNLPYTDMRRVGKIPKLLAHRIFPSARYSIWLDSKLRLQYDPLLILEYFLWRKGYEFAISNHYDRHCVWEEVAQNKRLNKYNHTIIDQQFAFYQADGLKRFNASDINKLLPSNVPEGSFIIRAHTPMSNLFSCLWFNEVERFTPRDQLSFSYTYQKLRRMNPGKPFYLNMFKDCERRKIAKLFRHRSDEKRTVRKKAME